MSGESTTVPGRGAPFCPPFTRPLGSNAKNLLREARGEAWAWQDEAYPKTRVPPQEECRLHLEAGPLFCTAGKPCL